MENWAGEALEGSEVVERLASALYAEIVGR